jgi:ParB/RepB/Spo0J family partition protein
MTDTDNTTFATTRLPLAKIKPGQNPRRYFDQAKHDELVASLRIRGMLQPILLRPTPVTDEFVIVAGERRHRAALVAFGADGEVPVIIRDMTDQEALEAAIDENDIREDASETEQADAAVRVLAACQDDRAEAARRLGWSKGKLDRRLALAHLSDAVKTALDERRIKVGHAELLAAVPGDKQGRALETILNAGLDVASTRTALMRMTQGLAGAIFDKTECTTCPFNSASQRALFETHVEDGHCTNPGCYGLKTEAAAAAQAKERKPDPTPAAPTPPTAPGAKGGSPAAAPSPTAKAPKGAPAAAPASVTAASIAKRVTDVREAAWRAALLQAVDGDPEIGRAFEATLRDSWQVDAAFLGRFGKDELKFIAHECGLVAHMGEKNFAKLLASSVPGLIAGMMNAKGFSWVGRLPGSMTVDGQYSPPPPAASAPPKSPDTAAEPRSEGN